MRQVILVEMTRTYFCQVVQSSWNVYRNPRCAVRVHIIPPYFLPKTKLRRSAQPSVTNGRSFSPRCRLPGGARSLPAFFILPFAYVSPLEVIINSILRFSSYFEQNLNSSHFSQCHEYLDNKTRTPYRRSDEYLEARARTSFCETAVARMEWYRNLW